MTDKVQYENLKDTEAELVDDRLQITASDPDGEDKVIKGVMLNLLNYKVENPVLFMTSLSELRTQEGLGLSVETLVRTKMLPPELQTKIREFLETLK